VLAIPGKMAYIPAHRRFSIRTACDCVRHCRISKLSPLKSNPVRKVRAADASE